MLKQKHANKIIALLPALAVNLTVQASQLKYMDTRMPYQPQTLLCACDLTKQGARLDGASCGLTHSNRVLRPLIPKSWMTQWLRHQGVNSYEKNLINATNDPIFNAYFANRSYKIYSNSTGITEGPTKPGFMGACSIALSNNNVLTTNGSKLGVISRAALYAEIKYGALIPIKQKEKFITYAKKYPPSPWELSRNEKSYGWSGTWNPYIGPITNFRDSSHPKEKNHNNSNIENNLNYLINRKQGQ